MGPLKEEGRGAGGGSHYATGGHGQRYRRRTVVGTRTPKVAPSSLWPRNEPAFRRLGHHVPMSSIEACLAGIEKVNQRILARPAEERRRHIRERSLSVVVPDLETVFDMRLTLEGLVGVVPRPVRGGSPRPQVRITVDSDDLVALAEDRLDVTRALLNRRVKVDASVGDLLRVRRLL